MAQRPAAAAAAAAPATGRGPRRRRPPPTVSARVRRALVGSLALGGLPAAEGLLHRGPDLSGCPERLRGARFLLVNNVCEQLGSARATILQLMKLAVATDRVFVSPFITSTPHTIVATDCGPECGGAAPDDYFPFLGVYELKHPKAVVPGLRSATFEEWRRCGAGSIDSVVAFPFKDEAPMPEGAPADECSPYMRHKIATDLGSSVSVGSRTCMPQRFRTEQLYGTVIDAPERSLLMYQWSKMQECTESHPCTSRLRLGLLDPDSDERGIAKSISVAEVDVDKEFKFRKSSPLIQGLMSQVLGPGCGPSAIKVLVHIRAEKLARRFGRGAAARCAPDEVGRALEQLREKLNERGSSEAELCTLVATDIGPDGSVTFVDVNMTASEQDGLARSLTQAAGGRPLLPGRTTIQGALGTLALAAWADAYADVGRGAFGQMMSLMNFYGHARPLQVHRSGNETCSLLEGAGS